MKNPSSLNDPPRLAQLSAAARKGIRRLLQIPLPGQLLPRGPVVVSDVDT
jgi:hypothetical protein